MASADLVILNKADQLDAEALARVRARRSPGAAGGGEDRRGEPGRAAAAGLAGTQRRGRAAHRRPADPPRPRRPRGPRPRRVSTPSTSISPRWRKLRCSRPSASWWSVTTYFASRASPPFRASPCACWVQGVGKRFDRHFDRKWLADEVRSTRLVVIGQELDQAAIAQPAAHSACLIHDPGRGRRWRFAGPSFLRPTGRTSMHLLRTQPGGFVPDDGIAHLAQTPRRAGDPLQRRFAPRIAGRGRPCAAGRLPEPAPGQPHAVAEPRPGGPLRRGSAAARAGDPAFAARRHRLLALRRGATGGAGRARARC